MIYTFDKSLETGNAAIDAQHKELINAVNNLLEACAKGKGRSEIETTVKFLADYTIKHFSDEEKLQKQHNYPGYEAHKKLHDAFKAEVSAIIDDYSKDGATVGLTFKINTKVAAWLINHIKGEDKKVAAFIKNGN